MIQIPNSKQILVIGSTGQLGKTFSALAEQYTEYQWIFASRSELEISHGETFMESYLESLDRIPEIWINCAAFTAVDDAETKTDLAQLVNTHGPKVLAKSAQKHGAVLIHFSTDYVYNGSSAFPISEDQDCHPLGAYGRSKLDGEVAIEENCNAYYILRTSWLYSDYEPNFVRTMLRLATNRRSLSVVADQFGSPTYAPYLARTTMQLIQHWCEHSENPKYGIYHYSDEGCISWNDFARTIFKMSHIDIEVSPITSEEFGAKAKRPAWSVLSKNKIKKTFGIQIPHWTVGLRQCLKKIST